MSKKSMSCPICRKPSIKGFDPFCSKYCKDQDLLAWMNQRYSIPVAPEEADSELPEAFQEISNSSD